MIKSETPSGNFLYVIFDGPTWYGYTESNGAWVEGKIGEIICVSEDGTYHDILGTEGSAEPDRLHFYDINTLHPSLQFDNDGNAYFMVRPNSAENWGTGVLYRYSPFTGEKTALTPDLDGITIEEFQISKDGTTLFTRGATPNAFFLRATPLSDTENPQNLEYTPIDGRPLTCQGGWIYDDESDVVYSVVGDSGLRKYIRNNDGKYSTESYIDLFVENEKLQNLGRDFHVTIDSLIDSKLENDGYVYTADWTGYLVVEAWDELHQSAIQTFIILNDDGSLNAENLYKAFLAEATVTSEEVDLRFDLFENIEGFEKLSKITKGKKNAEALAVLDTTENRGLLGSLLSNKRYEYDAVWQCYYHNFLADILYVKDTDVLLVETENSPFSISSVKSNGFYSNGLWPNPLTNVNGVEHVQDVYFLSPEYQKENGEPDTQKILDVFFSYCNAEGEKEFRLTGFKNDEVYGDLYSELTDNEAIAYITTNSERIQLLRDYLWNENNGSITGCLKFLNITCFLKETNTSAFTLIDFDGSNEFDNFHFDYGNAFFLDKGELWAWMDSYTRLLKILDSNHEYIGEINTIGVSNIPKGMYSKGRKIADGYIYFLQESDAIGFQHIYRIPIRGGSVEDMFTDVQGNWEILSFAIGGDSLYYSSYRGTAINNGKISLLTKANSTLDTNFKLSNLTTY